MGLKIDLKSISTQLFALIIFIILIPIAMMTFNSYGLLTDQLMVLVTLVLAAVLLGVSYLLIRQIVTPLHRLTRTADRIAAGNLDAVMETGASDSEVGRLIAAVSQMVAAVKNRLNQSESLLRGFSDPVLVIDGDAKITFINGPAQKVLGCEEREALGQAYTSIVVVPGGESKVLATLKTGEIFTAVNVEMGIRKGSKIPVRISASPIRDAGGNITGAILIFQDITREKEVEAALMAANADAQERAAYSHGILLSIKDPHLVLDTAGRVTYWNEAAQKILGYTSAEAIGRPVTDLTQFETHSGSVIGALRTGQDILGQEDRIRLRNGSMLPVVANASVVRDAHGNITGLSIIARDITREVAARENLRAIVRTSSEIAARMEAAAQEASTAVGQAMTSSRQISETITQIASGSQSQASEIDRISSLIKSISADAGRVSDGAKAASSLLKEATKATKQVDEAAKQAIGKMADIEASVSDSATIVLNLGEQSKQIGQIVEVITSIASQTNLLALNAAIEAARAGEAGRGFAVVAEEVRKLAEDSAKSTSQISGLICQIREQTDLAVASMEKGTSEVAMGSEVVSGALKSIEEISRLVNQVAGAADGVSAATDKQVRETLEMVQAVEQISAVVEESASATEEVSASSEESTATMDETASIARQVLKMAEELKAEVNKLQVS